MSIVRVEPQHFDQLFTLIEAMVEESVFSQAKPSRAKIQRLLDYPKTGAFLAYKGNTCIGFIAAVIDSFFFSDYVRAIDLGFYILPAHRGGRAAFDLLRTIEAWAKDQDVSEFYMGHSVGGKVDEMKKFYIHNGYTISGFNSVKKL